MGGKTFLDVFRLFNDQAHSFIPRSTFKLPIPADERMGQAIFVGI
jgi:hypothetical protein